MEIEEVRQRVWKRLIKRKAWKGYSKTGRFYIVDFPILFDVCFKEFKRLEKEMKKQGGSSS